MHLQEGCLEGQGVTARTAFTSLAQLSTTVPTLPSVSWLCGFPIHPPRVMLETLVLRILLALRVTTAFLWESVRA